MPPINPTTLRAATRHLKRTDPTLADIIRRIGPCRLECQTRRFESLTRAIIAQQISGSAAKSISNRLRQTLHPHRITPDSLASLPDEALRACGISPQKLRYLRDLQTKVADRSLPLQRLHHLPDEDVIDSLIKVKGIGLWTAQMFLIFSLGRPDVLPHQDLGIRSAIRDLYVLQELPDRDTCEKIANPWRPYASIACWYLWRSTEL